MYESARAKPSFTSVEVGWEAKPVS